MMDKAKGNERKRTFMLITIPILVLFFAFNTLPLIKGFIYSFTNFKGYGSYEWVGLRNYIDLFQDARVGRSYLFTFKFAIVSTIIVNVVSLILALGLNSKIRAKSALRGIYFIPNVLGACCRLYLQLYFYLHSPGCRTGSGNRSSQRKYAGKHENRMVRYRDRGGMAVHRHEHHHLYFRPSDSAGGCIRGRLY